MQRLNNQLLKTLQGKGKAVYPERILQYGEGNFLRGFVDWMIDILNEKGLFGGSVVLVQPIGGGSTTMINEQDGLYTLILRGISSGTVVQDKRIISAVSRGLNPYTEYAAYLACAGNPDLRFIVSNTTEAGIAWQDGCKLSDQPPASFPAKLTQFLKHRFDAFKGDAAKGLVIIPCELIDRNGDNLRTLVLRHAEEWQLGGAFIDWVKNHNHFFNTLVDRIVTGYPKDELEAIQAELGYEDQALDTAEPFHAWVIEGDTRFEKELPFRQAGLDVIWTTDMTPWRTRKVRILNGAHTMTTLAAYVAGLDTVRDFMEDPQLSAFMRKGLFEEIIPTLDLPKSDLDSFAAAVSERFANPFIKHLLLSISLNSTSKFKVRCLPSLLAAYERTGVLPAALCFALAAQMVFYRGTEIRDRALIGMRAGVEYKISDDLPVLELYRDLWKSWDGTPAGSAALARTVLGKSEFWDQDLNRIKGLTDLVSGHLHAIATDGVRAALGRIL